MEPILQIQNISKYFGDFCALDDVNITIEKGSIFGLLGPNGAGKTTLIRIITKIYAADKGAVFFRGNELTEKDVLNIGYLPEERGLYKKMKVGEQLIYLARLKGVPAPYAKARITQWFERLDIADWWNKKIDELSKGMQQKVQFIASILHEPNLIILDEPFTGFDPVNANVIKNEILKLRDNGATIIFSTHRMESVEELCDHIALINKSKKILDGAKQKIKEEHKENIFEVEYHGDLGKLNHNFDILSTQNVRDDIHKATIRSAEPITHNELLKILISQVDITSFYERLPSINDIFIKRVQEVKS